MNTWLVFRLKFQLKILFNCQFDVYLPKVENN